MFNSCKVFNWAVSNIGFNSIYQVSTIGRNTKEAKEKLFQLIKSDTFLKYDRYKILSKRRL